MITIYVDNAQALLDAKAFPGAGGVVGALTDAEQVVELFIVSDLKAALAAKGVEARVIVSPSGDVPPSTEFLRAAAAFTAGLATGGTLVFLLKGGK